MWNWLYDYLEVHMLVNIFFWEWNVLKVISEQGCVTTTWMMSSANISSDAEKLLLNKQEQVSH